MKCSGTGCQYDGLYVPMVCVPAVGYPAKEETAMTMILDVRFCRRHAERFQVSDVMDVPNEKGSTLRQVFPAMARVAAAQQGRSYINPPDTERAWIVPLRADNPRYLDYQRVSKREGQ